MNLDQAGSATWAPGTVVNLRAYFASINSSQMYFDVTVRNDANNFAVLMREDIIVYGPNRMANVFSDAWYLRTVAKDIFVLPSSWGQLACLGGATPAQLDAYAIGMVASANAAAAGLPANSHAPLGPRPQKGLGPKLVDTHFRVEFSFTFYV